MHKYGSAIAVLLLCVGLFCLAQSRAQVPVTGAGAAAHTSSGCSPGTAATNFLARTSGLSGTETTAYCNMINGLVTDGIITGNLSGATGCGSVLDVLYIFATNTTTTANLNLCGTSYGATLGSATVSFSSDHGYTGDGTAGYLNTNFAPGSSGTPVGNYSLNSATVGAYVLTNRTTAASTVVVGINYAGSYSYISPLINSGGLQFNFDVNGASFPVIANTTAKGHWTVTRNASSSVAAYLNGSPLSCTPCSSDSSVALSNSGFTAAAFQDNGTIDQFSTDQISAVYLGAGISSGQAAAIDNRINGYMTALGINVH